MNKLLGCLVWGIFGFLIFGCGQPAQPVAVMPTSATPSGVVTVVPDAPVKTVLEKAGKGSGLKGRSLDPHEGIVVTPAKAYFSAKERIQFEIEIPYALRLHEAGNGDIKTHDEFMEKIITANGIKLLELPPGHKYVYDPTTKTLMVEKPAP
jgi:hypothetical protein